MPAQQVRAQDTYVSMLMPEGHGYPLWLPDLPNNLPREYTARGIRVGDLGYFDRAGEFVYLFNVSKGADHPINRNRTPPDFVQLRGIPEDNVRGRPDRYMGNTKIYCISQEQKSTGADLSVEIPIGPATLGANVEFEFSSSSTRAAFLVLPKGGTSYQSEYPVRFQNHALSYGASWYNYACNQGRDIPNNMLYLVTGCVKCSCWGNASYSHWTESRKTSLRLSAAEFSSGGLHYNWEVDTEHPVYSRSHPGPPSNDRHNEGPPSTHENQTVFLSGYAITVQSQFSLTGKKQVAKIDLIDASSSDLPQAWPSKPSRTGTTSGTAQDHNAGVKKGTTRRPLNHDDPELDESSYDELPAYSGGGVPESSKDESDTDLLAVDPPYGQADTSVQVQPFPERGEVVHPAALINNYILATYRDATIAITHDDFEWTGMENKIHNPLDVVELANYVIDNDLVFINESETTPNGWVAKRRDKTFARQNDIFALVIGIDKYQHKEYKDLQSACGDADKFEAYLLEDLQTPKANIVSLRDGKATRSAIIDELIKMPDIRQHVIIIYFAGYGAATTKPKEWTNWETPNNEIGMLCPTDIGIVDENGHVVGGIPDRTISQLLNMSYSPGGNNITLILDCSYAGFPSDTQKPDDVPAGAERRQIFNPPKLSPSCDQQIYSGPGSGDVPKFGSSLLDSYVLLTACSPLQFAYESQGEGLFTRALLKVTKGQPIGNLTYKSLIHSLDMPGYQTPLLGGRNRWLFDSRRYTADSSRIPCHHEKDRPYFTLYAGSDHGITAGSVFEIYRTDLTDKQSPLTTATVERVEACVSFLKPVDQTIFIIHKSRRIWYARSVDSLGLGFTIYCNNRNFLAHILDEGVGLGLVDPPSYVSDPRLADLCLTVDGRVVFYDLGDSVGVFSHSVDFSPRFSHASNVDAIAEIRNIIAYYAHFISGILMPSLLPVTKLVSIGMKKIGPSGEGNLPVGEDPPPNVARRFAGLSPSPEIQERRYGFTIHNTSDVPLYVSSLVFDTNNLSITTLYYPATRLEPHSTVTFDRSRMEWQPLTFSQIGQNAGVTSLKLFVTEEPIDLDILSQPSPLAEGSERHIKRRAWRPSTYGKRWASMTIPVILRRYDLIVLASQ
ncbi:hypothetical protein EDD85DRAFT_961868 [Armillaria nabsnona]|nr:hypothetical protein EDD85DRAFT_961868 [Armillaria nabsnona]